MMIIEWWDDVQYENILNYENEWSLPIWDVYKVRDWLKPLRNKIPSWVGITLFMREVDFLYEDLPNWAFFIFKNSSSLGIITLIRIGYWYVVSMVSSSVGWLTTICGWVEGGIAVQLPYPLLWDSPLVYLRMSSL